MSSSRRQTPPVQRPGAMRSSLYWSCSTLAICSNLRIRCLDLMQPAEQEIDIFDVVTHLSCLLGGEVSVLTFIFPLRVKMPFSSRLAYVLL